MSFGKAMVWLFARNTPWGMKVLGRLPTPERIRLQQRLEGRWASKYVEKQGTVELLVGLDGNPTTTYPHVHVIHDEVNDEVRILASVASKNVVFRETLPGTSTGNDVNDAIERALVRLRRHV